MATNLLEQLEAEFQALQDDHKRRMDMAFDLLRAAANMCNVLGVVPRMDVAPNDPPSMGTKELRISVRMVRSEYQKSMELERQLESHRDFAKHMGGDYDSP